MKDNWTKLPNSSAETANEVDKLVVSKSQLLFLILDVHPYWWGRLSLLKQIKISFENFIHQITIFCNSFLTLSPTNSLCVAGFHVKDALLFRSKSTDSSDQQYEGHDFCQSFSSNLSEFMAQIQENDQILVDKKSSETSGFIPAMIKCLCIANKSLKPDPNVDVRFLIIKLSPILSAEYLPLMNCLFACQKQKYVVDVFSMCFNTTSLQQMSSLSNGIFLKCPEDSTKILSSLLLHFLMPSDFRQGKLRNPGSALLDYKASCFCHRKLVDIGWVCSLCLSVFCAFTPVCITCSSMFKLPNASVSSRKRKPQVANGV